MAGKIEFEKKIIAELFMVILPRGSETFMVFGDCFREVGLNMHSKTCVPQAIA